MIRYMGSTLSFSTTSPSTSSISPSTSCSSSPSCSPSSSYTPNYVRDWDEHKFGYEISFRGSLNFHQISFRLIFSDMINMFAREYRLVMLVKSMPMHGSHYISKDYTTSVLLSKADSYLANKLGYMVEKMLVELASYFTKDTGDLITMNLIGLKNEIADYIAYREGFDVRPNKPSIIKELENLIEYA